MSTSNSLPSQGNQQGPCVPLLPKPKITGREIALEGAEKVSRFQCRLPGCTNAFVTELGLCRKHRGALFPLFTAFYDHAQQLLEALAHLGIDNIGDPGATGDPFLTRCDRFLNDAAPNWFDDVDACLNNQAARKAKTQRRKRGAVTAMSPEAQPMARRTRAS